MNDYIKGKKYYYENDEKEEEEVIYQELLSCRNDQHADPIHVIMTKDGEEIGLPFNTRLWERI